MRRIRSVDAVPLRVPLVDPFVIANARLDAVHNVAVRVVLDDGAVGWGEIGTLHPVTTERFEDALAGVALAAEDLVGAEPGGVTDPLAERLPDFAATRAGIEQACVDALARSAGVPLYRWFGGVAPAPVVTDVTLPIGTPERAGELAALWRSRGFDTLKVKVGLDLATDLARLAAIGEAHPDAGLVLDANEGWTAEQALEAVRFLGRRGQRVVLLEQPVPRADLDGLARLTREAGVWVAADEACKTVADVERLARERQASAINVKIAKSGVQGALDLIRTARRLGLRTMIGAMVETRIGTGFSAHLVAGLGGFVVVDLDTPWLMTADPIDGGPALDGPVWRIDPEIPGHGGRPA